MEQETFITLIIGSLEENFWLLGYQQNKGYFLPNAQGKFTSWIASACKAYKTITGMDINNPFLWKIIRVWRGDDVSFLTNAIFKVPINGDEKKKIVFSHSGATKEKYFWFSQDEILSLVAKNEISKEIACYIPFNGSEPSFSLFSENEITICKPSLIIKKPKNVVGQGNLIEISKSNIIADIERLLNPNDMLLIGSKLHEKEQTSLYNEYLNVTFPNLLMNLNAFRDISSKIRLNPKQIDNYFRSADIGRRGCIHFKEFLYLIAAIEPKITHTGTGVESKLKFIFRYFDKNSDGRLDSSDIRDIYYAINPEEKVETIDERLNYIYGFLQGELTFHNFKGFLSKIEGINSVFVNTKSIFDILENVRKEKTSNVLRLAEFPMIKLYKHYGAWKDMEGIDYDYYVGNNCVKVCESGKFKTEEMSAIGTAFHNIDDGDDSLTSPSSSFNNNHPSNVVLSALKNFAYEDQEMMKPAFTWNEDKFYEFYVCLKELCVYLVPLFKKESRLLVVDSPVYIFGDIHGNYHDIRVFEENFWSKGINLTPINVLFLGDYVDRGDYSVEVVAYLFAQKFQNPSRVFLIRGNHEIREVQKNFTFHYECLKKFGSEGQEMFERINNVFDCLPLAAVVDEKIFCCHGGIPPPWLCPVIHVINSIPCPLINVNEENILAWELMWNDPLKEGENTDPDTVDLQLKLNKGFASNKRRATGHIFNYDALLNFLKVNNLSYVIRAHESQDAGFQFQFKNKLLTVFSSSHYARKNNDAACVLAQDRKLRVFRIDSESVYNY